MKSTCRRRVSGSILLSFIAVLIRSGIAFADVSTVREKASLEPVGGIDLVNTIEQKLRVVFIVPHGKIVEKGALLAELDPTSLRKRRHDYQIRVEKIKAELAAARSALLRSIDEGKAQIKVAELRLAVAQGAKKVFVEAEYPLEVKTLEQEISITKLMCASVTERVKEVLKQYQEHHTGKQELDEVQLNLSELQAQLTTLQARLHFVQTLFLEQRKTEFELAIAERNLEAIRVHNQFQHTEEKGEAALERLHSRQKMELDQLARLEEQIKACAFYAPKEGIVLYPQQRVERGSWVRDRQVLLHVVDRKRFDMNFRVALAYAQQVATGQMVTVRVDAFPERTVTGRITRIRVLSEQTRKASEAMVTVRVDDPSGKFQVGMSGVVEFELQRD
jgi:HlyD family secretion protein